MTNFIFQFLSNDKIIKTYLLCFAFTCITINVNGQENEKKIDCYSMNLNLGLYNMWSNDLGIVLGTELDIIMNKFIYSSDYYRYEEFNLFEGGSPEFFHQIGFMIGKYNGDELFRFLYQGGLNAIWGTKKEYLKPNNYERRDFFTLGLISKCGFRVIPLKFLAIGFDLQLNINPEKSVFMPMISLEFGKLKK